MNNLTVIYSVRSTNGQWGVDVVGPKEVEEQLRKDYYNHERILQGSLTPLGEQASIRSYLFTPASSENYIIISNRELKPVFGCVIVEHQGLQSSQDVVLLHARIGAVYQWYGYKGRSSGFLRLNEQAQLETLSPALLLALGLITPINEPESIPEVPDLPSYYLEALNKLKEE